MKKYYYIAFLLLVLNFPAYAQETSEVPINNLTKDVFDIVMGANDDKMGIAVDHSIEILKRNPWSIDALGIIMMFQTYTVDENIEKKYQTLKEKYFSTIDDLSIDTAEKLMLLFLGNAYAGSIEETKENTQKTIEILKKNKDIIKDKKITALITMMLFYDRQNLLSNINEFLEKYPDHPAVPLVELNKLSITYKKEPQKCIEEIEKWIKKYDNLMSPLGWKLNVDGYDALLNCYQELDDKENLKKYVKILNDISPNFFKGVNARWLDYLDDKIEIYK